MFEALRDGGPRKRDGGGARWGCELLDAAALGARVAIFQSSILSISCLQVLNASTRYKIDAYMILIIHSIAVNQLRLSAASSSAKCVGCGIWSVICRAEMLPHRLAFRSARRFPQHRERPIVIITKPVSLDPRDTHGLLSLSDTVNIFSKRIANLLTI